jgi:hypothetical protein
MGGILVPLFWAACCCPAWFCQPVTVTPQEPQETSRSFGAGCQRDYQNDWLEQLDWVWNRCGGFNDKLDDTDSKSFYYNLHGAKWWWETGGDQLTLDNVDLFYGDTHGGAGPNNSVWSMWDQDQNAMSSSMRLGDGSRGLSIFATYSCHTLRVDDGRMWTRMGPIFSGGLRFAAGSHDLIYDSETTDETGEDFAENLQDGQTIRHAWKDSSTDWNTDQDIAIMATGTNEADCENRRDNMRWQDFTSYPRLRDNQIGYYCYRYWDDL